MAPKGLAAAVLASLPLQYGLPGGEMIRDLTYAVILTSIVLTSILIPVLEKVPAVSAFYGAIIRKGRRIKTRPASALDETPKSNQLTETEDGQSEN